MSVTGLLQIGLAQPGEPPLAIDRLGVTETVLAAAPHSPRFSASDAAVQWLVVVDGDQFVPLLGQVAAAWTGSTTNLSWRSLGESTPLSEVITKAAASTAQQQPANDGLRVEPQRGGIATG